ncbi:chorismate mutase [Methanobrevibacter sp.]|uniref:chorismate mutase n=1 Tax=Methanobrevibacter sp. TaxID=66852 RepID=UPI003890E0C5
MSKSFEGISFKDKKEAELLLKECRDRIDEIDNELFDLISQRTSLAKDIALCKEYIGMPIYDKSREEDIHKKIEKFSEENGLDVDIVNQIVDMLTILNKNEQKEILRRNVNGQY